MSPRVRRKLRQASGKGRRFLTTHFRKAYITQQAEIRLGECDQCGNCCEILFRCPFLVRQDDGTALCSIYDSRPGQCAAFPIDHKCLAEVDFECSYRFPGRPGGLKNDQELLILESRRQA